MKKELFILSIMVLAMLLAIPVSSQDLKDFSVMPPRLASVSVQKNSEWETLLIALDANFPKNFVPVVTDSTVELSVAKAPQHSSLFQTANSSFAKGVAWSEGKLVVYLNRGKNPAVMIMKNRILLQSETSPGRLENWQARPTGLKRSNYFLPSYEPLAPTPADFAQRFGRRRDTDLSLSKAIQVKRLDASYVVIEDIASLFASPHEGKPLEAMEFGDRLKVLSKQPPHYKVRYKNRDGYVRTHSVLLETELTTVLRDKLRRLKKEVPGGVDSVAAKFGWKDSDKIIYSSYGFRDPFIEAKSFASDGINVDNLTLAGIIFENEKPMALLSDNKRAGRAYTLYEGDTVKNGKILKISKNSVLFLLQEYGVSRRYTMALPDKYGGEK